MFVRTKQTGKFAKRPSNTTATIFTFSLSFQKILNFMVKIFASKLQIVTTVNRLNGGLGLKMKMSSFKMKI